MADRPLPHGRAHVDALIDALTDVMPDLSTIQRWGQELARVLTHGGRVLVCGNGGSAAQAQHLTSELVGRYRDERRPFSALALHAESSSVTAITNDYGYDQVFARQVGAHGRPGDILIALSTSGRSPNVIRAVEGARRQGLVTWALTGMLPNPLAQLCHETVAVPTATVATVQEVHLVMLHLICAEVDIAVGAAEQAEDHLDLPEAAPTGALS